MIHLSKNSYLTKALCFTIVDPNVNAFVKIVFQELLVKLPQEFPDASHAALVGTTNDVVDFIIVIIRCHFGKHISLIVVVFLFTPEIHAKVLFPSSSSQESVSTLKSSSSSSSSCSSSKSLFVVYFCVYSRCSLSCQQLRIRCKDNIDALFE